MRSGTCIVYQMILVFSFSVDNTPPTISNCPSNIDRTVELGSPGLPVSWLEPTATDLGAVVTLTTRSHEPGSTFNIGTTTVTYTFTDNSGNSASCVFTVTVVPSKISESCSLHF